MEKATQQKKELINGIASNILCHMQEITASGVVYPAHFHSYIELLYIVSGDYEVILNNAHHNFSKGDLVIMNSNEIHQINSFGDKGNYYVLRFEPEVVYNSMFASYEYSKYMLTFLLGSYTTQVVIKCDKLQNSSIPEIFQAILLEFNTQPYGFELSVKIHTEQIYLWILRFFHQENPDTFIPAAINSETARHLQPCFNYVALHYDEEITSIFMAKLCHMSTSYFSRIFNKLMKMTFHDYVNYTRIQEAEKLLLSTALNITEISSTVGFNTTSYFIRTFKEYKQISPKQYRKSFE